MKILDRFELGVERLLEGSLSGLFRSHVQPAEIGRKLERAMIAGQVASVDSTLVPNDYRVTLHPVDTALFSGYTAALSTQMEAWLTETAHQRGFTLIDRVRIQITADQTVRRRAIRVVAAVAERPEMNREAQNGPQRTEVYRAIRADDAVPPLRLHFLDHPRRVQDVVIRKPLTTVGRALDNDIVLESGDVSRHHARLEYVDGATRLVDLGSTNGTRLNDQLVVSERVRVGDNISFGGVKARLLAFDADGN